MFFGCVGGLSPADDVEAAVEKVVNLPPLLTVWFY